MNSEYLSIKEFAERVGVSQQAIYKQLNNKLKPYLKVVEKKKMLSLSALELFEKPNNSSTVEQQLINMLQTELKQKNEQIEQLQKLLDQEQQLRMVEHKRILELEEKQAIEAIKAEESKPWWKKIF